MLLYVIVAQRVISRRITSGVARWLAHNGLVRAPGSRPADDVSDIGLLCTYGCRLNVAYMSTFVVVV